MKMFILIFLIIAMGCMSSCLNDDWMNHYEDVEEEVNMKLWDAVKNMEQYSEFVKYIEKHELDKFIQSTQSKTLFIPNNEAFVSYFEGDTTDFRETMKYLIIPTLFVLRNVDNERKLQTFSTKYALIKNIQNTYYFDDYEIIHASP
jgi:hypothetical protein